MPTKIWEPCEVSLFIIHDRRLTFVLELKNRFDTITYWLGDTDSDMCKKVVNIERL